MNFKKIATQTLKSLFFLLYLAILFGLLHGAGVFHRTFSKSELPAKVFST